MTKKKKKVEIDPEVELAKVKEYMTKSGITLTELIDLGGTLDKDLKKKAADFEQIKSMLRLLVGELKQEEIVANDFILKADKHVMSTMNPKAIIKSYLHLDVDKIDKEGNVTLNGKDLADFLAVATVSVENLRKNFTADTFELLVKETKVKPFHTLTFVLKEKEES